MNKLLIVVCVFLLQNISATEIAKNQLSENSHYSVQISSIKDRSAHLSATMTLAENKNRMAAWGHPSLQHGWATFVTNLVVTDSKGNNITVTPIDDKGWGSWHVDANNGQTIHLEYDVSFSHDQHDWNPAGGQDSRPAVTNDALFLVTKALFIYSPGTKQSTIQFQIPEKWNIASSWATVSGQKNTYKAESWISLVNNAIVIGDYAHRTISAKSMNIILAIDQQLNHHTEMFERVFHLQLENYTNIFGQNKDATYLVTIRQSDEDDGEAFNDSFNQVITNNRLEQRKIVWANTMGHELFHYWNGNRFLVAKTKENGEWFSEGFTEYYSSLTLLRTGLINEQLYFKKLERYFARYMITKKLWPEQPISLVEAGKDKHKNWLLVYGGGATLALILDIEIRDLTAFIFYITCGVILIELVITLYMVSTNIGPIPVIVTFSFG